MSENIGHLQLDSFAGRSSTRVDVIGVTATRYRIRAITRTKLAGRARWLNPGDVALVPHSAVRDNCEVCKGLKGGCPGNENRIDDKLVCDYCHAEKLRKVSP
jgi:hypothetical protein